MRDHGDMLDTRHLITKLIGSFTVLWISVRVPVPGKTISLIPIPDNSYLFMPVLKNTDLFPIAMIGIITVIAFMVFWSVMDMVLLGGSLAIVLMPLHQRLSTRVRPHFSAAIITGGVLAVFAGAAYITLMILTANAATLTSMFTSIGTWLNDPATNPISYGVPLSKATLSSLLSEGNEIFVDYEKTLIANLYLILFKMFVFFFSLSALLFHGDWLKERFMSHMPPVICEWVTRLSAVTVDTLYAIYVVQVAIAVLTFFIALPVFALLGYGDVLFYSFLAAFCELIPVLGSSATFLLVGAYALAQGDARGVFIMFFLGYLIVSCVPEIYVRPVLVGRRVKINAVIMFIGIIGGILTMGLAGFVLGPVMIVLLITSFRIYASGRKERKEAAGASCGRA
jgi:predicted PurR-regulated permease PerM